MSDKSIKSLTCDECEKELIVDSKYPHKYSLKVSAIDTGINTSASTFMVAVYPPIENDLHFCGMKCLKSWASK